MYERKVGSVEAILTEYMRTMAPQDYEDIGIDHSTMKKAANPMNRRQLSFKDAIKIENFCADYGLPQYLCEYFNENIETTIIEQTSFKGLMDWIVQAKKEADDVSDDALLLLSDGDASYDDLKKLLKETSEAYLKFRRLKGIIEQQLTDLDKEILK